MRNAQELIVTLGGAVCMLTPLVLTSAAWWKWKRARRPHDSRFLTGTTLATIACCEIVPFWIPVTTQWQQLRVDVILYGALVSAACAIAALVVLPFARFKAKWLVFTSSGLMILFVAMFLFSLSV